MGGSSTTTMTGIPSSLTEIDVTQNIKNIQCPTLVITTTGSALGVVSDVDAWRNLIPRDTLYVMDKIGGDLLITVIVKFIGAVNYCTFSAGHLSV